MAYIKLFLLILIMDASIKSSFSNLIMNLDINVNIQQWLDQTCDLNIMPTATPNTCCVNCTCGGAECHKFGPWCDDSVQDDSSGTGEITSLTSGYLTCATQQLRPFDAEALYPNAVIEVNVVQNCPTVACSEVINDLDESVEKCENSERYSDLSSIIPVVDARTGIPYKNRYCARCHGVPDVNVTEWTVKVECNGEFYWPTSRDHIITDIYNTRTCNIIYEVPLNVVTSFKCLILGNELCYADINVVCYSKPAILTTMCLLKHNKSRPADCPHIHKYENRLLLPFSLLLGSRLESDTGSLDISSSKQSLTSEKLNMTIRESGSFFDYFKNVERNVTCLPPRELRQGSCYTASRDITGAAFNFSIKVIPINAITAEESTLTSQCVLSEIGDWMYNISLNWAVQASCYKTLASARTDLKPAINVEYFIIEIDAVVGGTSFDVQIIDKVLELDGTTNTSLNACGNEFLMELVRRERFKRIDDDIMYSEVDDHMLYKIKLSLMTLFPKGFSVLTSMILNPALRCPLVTLDISEYEIELFTWGVTIADLNASISRWYIQESYASGDLISIQICFDTYNNLIKQSLASGHIENADVKYSTAIGIVSFVCIGLSIICLLLTLLTFGLFMDMRNQPGVNNMALCVSLLFAQVLLQFGIGQTDSVPDWACEAIGVLIHFFWLNTVAWMNICCFHCYGIFRDMKEKQNCRFSWKTTMKYMTYSLAFATVPVIANITSNMLKDDPDIGYGKLFCYISEKRSILMTFALPTGVLLLINISLFIATVIKVKRLPAAKITSGREQRFCGVYARLSTITGCLWLFGYVYMATGEPALEYLFVIFNASQGVFIFVSFVCNKTCFRKWLQLASGKSVATETRSTKVTSSQSN